MQAARVVGAPRYRPRKYPRSFGFLEAGKGCKLRGHKISSANRRGKRRHPRALLRDFASCPQAPSGRTHFHQTWYPAVPPAAHGGSFGKCIRSGSRATSVAFTIDRQAFSCHPCLDAPCHMQKVCVLWTVQRGGTGPCCIASCDGIIQAVAIAKSPSASHVVHCQLSEQVLNSDPKHQSTTTSGKSTLHCIAAPPDHDAARDPAALTGNDSGRHRESAAAAGGPV